MIVRTEQMGSWAWSSPCPGLGGWRVPQEKISKRWEKKAVAVPFVGVMSVIVDRNRVSALV